MQTAAIQSTSKTQFSAHVPKPAEGTTRHSRGERSEAPVRAGFDPAAYKASRLSRFVRSTLRRTEGPWFSKAALQEPYNVGEDVLLQDARLGIKSINLQSNETQNGCAPQVHEAVKSLPDTAYTRYPDDRSTELNAAVLEHHGLTKSDGIQAVFGPALSPLMAELNAVLLQPGRNSVVPEHAYQPWMVDTKQTGAKVKVVETPGLQVDTKAVFKAIDHKTSVVYLDNPANPTGTAIPPAELKAFLSAVEKKWPQVMVIVDAAYAEFAQKDNHIDLGALVKNHPNTIGLKTLSKAYGLPGVRVGYALCSDKLANRWKGFQQIYELSAHAQAAGLAAIKNQDFVKFHVSENAKCREAFCAALDTMGIHYVKKSNTNFVMLFLEKPAEVIDRAFNVPKDAKGGYIPQNDKDDPNAVHLRFRPTTVKNTVRVGVANEGQLPLVINFFQSEVKAGRIDPAASKRIAESYDPNAAVKPSSARKLMTRLSQLTQTT
jgi:histidinol-phosphate aminotransferase